MGSQEYCYILLVLLQGCQLGWHTQTVAHECVGRGEVHTHLYATQ